MNKNNLSVLAGLIGLGLTKKIVGSRSLRLFEMMGIDFKDQPIQIESTVRGELLVEPYGLLSADLDLETELGKFDLGERVTDELYYRIKEINAIANKVRRYVGDNGEMTIEQFVNFIDNYGGRYSHEEDYIIDMINNDYFEKIYRLFKNLIHVSFPNLPHMDPEEETLYICTLNFAFNISNTKSQISEMVDTFFVLIEYGDEIAHSEGHHLIVDPDNKLPEKFRPYVHGTDSDLRRF